MIFTNFGSMKNILLTIIIISGLVLYACENEGPSNRFVLLTAPVWVSDSLLADGVDASGPGQALEKFNGEVVFNKDGTGVFGVYTGTWKLVYSDTEIVISSDSLPFPITNEIKELTENSLKITTGFPDLNNPAAGVMKIRMTFKSK